MVKTFSIGNKNGAARLAFVAPVLLLAACGSSDAEPTGQVAATVDGKEVTVADVNFELGGASSDNPEQQKQMTDAALGSVVNRKILADAAREQGLDDTPTAAITLQKAQDLALIDLLRRSMAEGVPKPSDDEAAQFMKDNPAMFANRTVSVVDQLAVPRVSEAVVKAMQPIETLAGIRALLDENKVEYSSNVGTVDTLTLPPAAAKQIGQMAIGAVYVVPGQGGGVRVNAVRSVQTVPVDGPRALELAKQMLYNQRVEGQTSQQIANIIKKGREKVSFNEKFKPAEQPQSGAGPKPAAPATGDADAPAE